MSGAKKLGVWALAAAGGLFLAGCQSSGSGAHDAAPSTQAIACSKCEVTYVRVPVRGGKGSSIYGYRSAKRMECPECKSIAENFFTTGKFQHTCTHCGKTLERCDAH